LHITGNATFDNQFKLNGQTTINADKDTKSAFNKAVKDADYNTDPGNDLTVKYREGSLVKTGLGEISLNAENLYSGNTDIQQGTVTVANNKALGKGNVTLQNDTPLQSGADVTLANKVELVSGNVTLATPQINPLTTPQNTSLTLTNTVSGAASLTKTGVGTLTLNGKNTYAGETIIKEGKVAINNAAALGVNTNNVTLNANAALSVNVVLSGDDALDANIARENGKPSPITLNQNISLRGASGSQATLSATGADVVLAGKLSNDANTVGIIKEGTGTLKLTNDNSSYRGKTTIKEGNLAISEAKNLGGKVLVELAGGGLNLLDSMTIGGAASTDSIDITGTRGAINTATGTKSKLELAFKGQGLFVKEGEGELILSGTNTEFSGGVSIDKGILTITKDDSLGKKDTTVILNGGTLQTEGVTALNRDVQLNQDSTIKNNGASTVGLNRLQGNYAVTLEGAEGSDGGFNLKAKIDETTDPDTVIDINQHNGTILKNTTVIIGNDADLGKSTGQLAFENGATLAVEIAPIKKDEDDDSIRNINIRNMSVEGTGNFLTVNNENAALDKFNVTLGVLSGKGDITKKGTGNLILDKNNKDYKGTLTISDGIVYVNKDNALGVGTAAFGNNVTLTTLAATNSTNNIGLNGALSIDGQTFDNTLNGVISGTGSLVKVGYRDTVNGIDMGTGTLTLTGDNTYSGGTNVQAGKVLLNADSALGTGKATFAKDTELSLDVNKKVLLDTGVTKGLSVANAIQVNGEVDVHTGSLDSSLTGKIEGAGSLVKDGTGQLSLTGANSYTGGTTINAGKVALGANTSLGIGKDSKATFTNNTELSLGITKGLSVDNNVQLDGAVKVHNGTFDSVLNGVISGVGSLVKDGKDNKDGGKEADTGILTLTGINTYEGGTIVNDGTLAISQNANLGKAETGVTVSNATLLLNGDIAIERKVTLAGTTATLNTAGNTSSSIDDAVSGLAKLIKTGDGTLTLNTANTYAGGTQIAKGTLEISQDASLGTKAGKFGVDVVIDDAATLALTGNVVAARKLSLTGTTATIDTTKEGSSSSLSDVISGSAKLIKTGDGSLTLTGANSYEGGTVVNKGTLAISSDANLGKAGTDVAINNATVALTANTTVARKLALTGATATVNTATSTTSSITDIISGTGQLVKEGDGSLTLTGSNSYEGGTVVNKGTLVISQDANLGKAGTSVAIGDAATLALKGNITTDTKLDLIIARKLALTGATATIDTTGANSITDIISGSTAKLIKTGDGSLTLTGANTYTSGTTISAGKVALDTDAALGTGTATFANNTELSLGTSKGVLIANDVQVDGKVQVHSGIFNSSLEGEVSGVGSLVKDGTGTLTLTGSNSYEGGTIVNDGTLAISQDANLGKAGTSVAITNATLALTANATVARKLDLMGNTATINTATGTASSITDIISGTGQLVKTGTGSLTLMGENTYEGGTVVNDGTLAISQDANLGKAGTSVAITNATLALTATTTVARKLALTGNTATINTATDTTSSITDIISGTGQLVKTGAGSLSLTGTNSYEGGTVVNGGTVTISSDANLGKAGTDVAINNATLALTANASVARKLALTGATATINTATDTTSSITDIISGTGQLVKTGAGSLSLTGTNSYEGGTVVNGGTVTISSDANLG
jgi:fibronectin-binding autotransporter adhesin